MELMSPLLLCVFLAIVPAALGKYQRSYSYHDAGNKTMTVSQRLKVGNSIFLNVQYNNDRASDLQAVFVDPSCKSCVRCMERVVKSHKVHRLSKAKDGNQLMRENNKIRYKRGVRLESASTGGKKSKKTKGKKSVSVIKYNENGEIYALKVKETSNLLTTERNATKASTTCQVYSVQKALPCDSPAADSILTQRNTDKKRRKVPGKREATLPSEGVTTVSLSRKTLDSSQQEHYMTSLEELY